MKLVTVTILAAAMVFVPARATAAVGGDITRAEVDPNWASGSFAGTVGKSETCQETPKEPESPERPEEPESPEEPGLPRQSGSPPIQPDTPPWDCGWTAYATVGPGTSIDDCSSAERRWGSIGAGVQVIWEGEEVTGPGSVSFGLPGLALEYGAAAPLLCLSAVESVREGVMCPEEEESCPPFAVVHASRQLDAALLQPPAAEAAVSPAGPISSQPAAPRPCRRQAKVRRHRHGRRIAISSGVRVAGKRIRSPRCKSGVGFGSA